ncbi:hypothetical protein PR202_ga23571 [Eleusine coracana subsp. coracana]|uniref:Secreted protein n=1 Tax=Eleusine coracana subsp. coracana TaxID=191504 RepID=A0AAV5D648_ELECO|nr:hypothetical protein PR202_ga23571 [Eleusine coracana subsp. coracana]
MDTQRNHRLLLVCWLFIIANSSARGAAGFLHPIVLLPGFGCSQLDTRAAAAGSTGLRCTQGHGLVPAMGEPHGVA